MIARIALYIGVAYPASISKFRTERKFQDSLLYPNVSIFSSSRASFTFVVLLLYITHTTGIYSKSLVEVIGLGVIQTVELFYNSY